MRGAFLAWLVSTSATAFTPEVLFRDQVAEHVVVETYAPDAATQHALRLARARGASAEEITRLLETSHPERDTLEPLAHAVARAEAALARWGGLHAPVHLYVLPTHGALEDVTHQEGRGWLRGWGRYDQVFLQAPQSYTWAPTSAPRRQLDEVVTHELTHCVMFQLLGTREDWYTKRVPLWFREGMASYTAEQAHRWVRLEDVERIYALHPELRAVARGEEWVDVQSELVYAAAHHAFSALVAQRGESSVRALLADMREGSSFEEGFAREMGETELAFVNGLERSWASNGRATLAGAASR